jgi:hypothetical protein
LLTLYISCVLTINFSARDIFYLLVIPVFKAFLIFLFIDENLVLSQKSAQVL